MGDDDARKSRVERNRLRRRGPNRRAIDFSIPPDLYAAYKAKCARLGLSMNRVGNDLIRAFVDEEDDL
jgi:hypothetical protein